MKQLKKKKLLPLTDLDIVNIQVATRKDYDLTGPDNETSKELLEKLFKIADNTPGAIIATKVGEKNYVNTQVKNRDALFSS